VARPRSEPRLLNRSRDQSGGKRLHFITAQACELRFPCRVVCSRGRAIARLSSMLLAIHDLAKVNGLPRVPLAGHLAPRAVRSPVTNGAPQSHIFQATPAPG